MHIWYEFFTTVAVVFLNVSGVKSFLLHKPASTLLYAWHAHSKYHFMLTQNAFPLNSAAGKKKRSDISYLRLKIMQYWKTFLSLIVLINVMRSDTGLQSLLHLRVMKEIRERGSMFVCFCFILFLLLFFKVHVSTAVNITAWNSLKTRLGSASCEHNFIFLWLSVSLAWIEGEKQCGNCSIFGTLSLAT